MRNRGDYIQAATRYMDGVLSGEIVAGHWVKRACQRQKDDLERDWEYTFNEDKAEHICAFVELLPHIKGKWARERRKIELEDWQVFTLAVVFGWVHKETGLRRFTEVYQEVARKNAKSTISAGVALYSAFADGEQGAEVYTAATTRDQAKIVFGDARLMAEREGGLRSALGVEVQAHRLVCIDSASKLEPLSAEGSTLDGLNVHCAIIDELHAHKRRDVYDVIDTARGSREQSLLWCITTAGTDRSGICYERRTHACQVLDGVTKDERLFGIVYTLDEGDDPLDPAVWPKANPNYGVSVLPDDMESAARKAEAMPSAMANFLTKRLNVWVNASSPWMDMQAWDKCADPTLTLEKMKGLPCWIGLDLASKVDVAAVVRLFKDGDVYHLIPEFYLPERALEVSTNSQYDGWRRSGWLRVTEGEVTDYDAIEDQIEKDMAALTVQEVPFDPWQATQLSSHLLAKGVPMVEFRQSTGNFSEGMKTLEALVLTGKLRHNGNPMMTWMISNTVYRPDEYENVRPRKERPENKIDGTVAAIMALSRAIVPAEKPKAEAAIYIL